MRCLTRYILFEFAKAFTVALLGMTLLIVLVVVVQEFLRRGLGPLSIARIIPFALPIALRFAVPATTLFAACSVFGRVAADNEVVAIKSLGISPLAILWPVFVVSFLLSLGVVGMNDVAVTWGRDGINRVALESIEQITYGMLRTQRSYRCDQFSINVKQVVGRKLIQPTLTVMSGDGAPVVFTADEAELSSDLASNTLQIRLSDWEMDGGPGVMMDWPGSKAFNIALPDSAHGADQRPRPADIAMGRLQPEIRVQLAEIAKLEQNLATEVAYHLLTGGFVELTDSVWEQRREKIRQAKERLNRLGTESWRRWASGFSCLAFAFVGSPLAMRLRNSDVWTSFAVCFFPILALYYPLLAFGVDQAKSGALPAYCVWVGNVVSIVIGIVLVKRALHF